MASFQIRPAAQSDFGSIRDLIRAARINPMGLDWRRFVVAINSIGDVVGCGQIKPHRDGLFEMASLAVDEDWRANGVGRAIIEHLLESQSGVIYLTCRTELGVFYEKFGFRVAENSDMPTYFRWVRRLFILLKALHLMGDGLLVMVRGPLTDQ